MKPTKEELLSLETVLVEGNKIITGVDFEEGYEGRGGSNSAPYERISHRAQTLDELSGKKIAKRSVSFVMNDISFAILAVVDDVIYLGCYTNECTIIEIPHDRNYVFSTEIAYDTELYFCVSPIQ